MTRGERAEPVLRVRMLIENDTFAGALRDYTALSDYIHTITADLCGAYGLWDERFHITGIQRVDYGNDQPVLRRTLMQFMVGEHNGTAVLVLDRWKGKYYVTYVLEVNP